MNIYLAPHHDDVCFSIVNWAERHGGLLISLFTRTTYLASPVGFPNGLRSTVEIVRKIREAEDILFAKEINLDRYDLMLDDSILSYSDPYVESDIKDDVTQLKRALLPLLMERLSQSSDHRNNILYCPTAIGGHRDHLITLMSIISEVERLRPLTRLAFYEDLPYARDPVIRRRGIDRLESLINLSDATTHVSFLGSSDRNRKMTLINLYASQHHATPLEADFVPASRLSPLLHEIIRITP